MARVILEHLSKVYPRPDGLPVQAVSDLTLAIENRELLVLLGPSGCGKTTTLRLLAGLEEPSAGTVSIDGRNMNAVAPKDRDVAMVFQNPALYPHLSVFENMAFGLTLRKLDRGEVARRVKEATSLLGLEDCLERLPMALSGGQRQRVAIGRALVRRPGLFLLDEPLSNLDVQLRAQMRLELARLHQRLQTTTVYVTHDQVEAMLLGHRLAVMKAGVLQQVGKPSELYQQPVNLFVAGFIGSPAMNFLHGRLEAQNGALFFASAAPAGDSRTESLRLQVGGPLADKLGGYAGKEIVLGLRPEHIHAQARAAGGAEQRREAVVERCETTGTENYLHVTWAGKNLVLRTATGQAPQPAEVELKFEMQQARFFDPATERAVSL